MLSAFKCGLNVFFHGRNPIDGYMLSCIRSLHAFENTAKGNENGQNVVQKGEIGHEEQELGIRPFDNQAVGKPTKIACFTDLDLYLLRTRKTMLTLLVDVEACLRCFSLTRILD